MSMYTDKAEYRVRNMPLFHQFLRMFNGRPDFQLLLNLGIVANPNLSDDMNDSDEYDDDYEYENYNFVYGYPGLSDWRSREAYGEQRTKLPSTVYQYPKHFYTKVQEEESDSERSARSLADAEKLEEKAEKKRLKKKRQKERKQLEKLKKESQNPVNKKEKEVDNTVECKAVEDKLDNDDINELAMTVSTKLRHLSKDESSVEEEESSSEELDLTSTFVSKAAVIARRKLEQKSKPARKEKKSPEKEKPRTVAQKPKEEPPDSIAPNNPTYEDNVRKSSELANIGNQFAIAGDFNKAVGYFTDAIKYNPKEFKLFGNRSFCFEKMQEYTKALADAELSLSMRPGWVKGLFRKGRALAGLKRYADAAQALREVLKVDSTCTEARQELTRVQISQLMEYGLSQEQSSKALIIHGSVEKALESLSKADHQPGAKERRLEFQENLTREALKTAMAPKPSDPKPIPSVATKTTRETNQPRQELYPVWVGNLVHTITETMLKNLFNKVGAVHSVKLLNYKRCAFVNFTHQDRCDEAIRHFHGFEFHGCRLAVRYPDRIPQGMGFSKSALVAEDLREENGGRNFYCNGRNGIGGRPPHRPFPDGQY